MRIQRPLAPARGIALPVILIILAVMLVGSIYLFKSTQSTALTTGNLAYDTTLSRAADLGLHTGFEWLSGKALSNKAALNSDDADHAYVASFDTTLTPRDSAFWSGSLTVTGDDGASIQYVIHRLCSQKLTYDDASNQCMQTAANSAASGTTVGLGDSLASDAPTYAATPQLHYMITARISGGRGASVTNQMIVLIGA